MKWPDVQYRSLLAARLSDQRDALLALPEGWNDGDEKRIDADTAARAIEVALLLAETFGYETTWLVPCSDGDVQVEIHEGGWDVECYIARVRPEASR